MAHANFDIAIAAEFAGSLPMTPPLADRVTRRYMRDHPVSSDEHEATYRAYMAALLGHDHNGNEVPYDETMSLHRYLLRDTVVAVLLEDLAASFGQVRWGCGQTSFLGAVGRVVS